MGSKMQKGQSDDAEVMNEAFTGTDAIVTSGDDMRGFDSIGIQLISEFNQEEFATSDDDDVDFSSLTWTLTEFDFTGLAGATIVVEGTATSDGTYVIDTVTSAHVIVTLTAPLADETFDGAGRITVVHTEDPPVGAWKIEVSNDFVPETNGTVYGQVSQEGTWTDITSAFSPTIAGVTTEGSQYAQADLTARDLRYTFTPASGQGIVKIKRFCKSWS